MHYFVLYFDHLTYRKTSVEMVEKYEIEFYVSHVLLFPGNIDSVPMFLCKKFVLKLTLEMCCKITSIDSSYEYKTYESIFKRQ